MHAALRRLAIGILTIANRILPDPDGKPRPLTEAEIARQKNPALQINFSGKPLHYKISQQDLSRIFRIESNAYEAAVAQKSIEIRELAGYPSTGVHQDVHGFGATQVMYADKKLNVYVNRNQSGPLSGTGDFLSRLNNMMNHIYNTVANIPKALTNAKTLKALIVKAHDHETPGALCEVAIVAQKPVGSDDPKRVIFIIQAEHMTDKDQNSPVILRNIFKPMVDSDGKVTGMARIDPKAAHADQEILRFMIFAKLVMDQMISKQPIDIAGNLKATQDLPLDKSSKLKDYMGFQPPSPPRVS